MPPHTGHQYLIRFARAFSRDLTVFVCTLSHEPIPGELRFRWMSELFPDVRLVHVTEEIPQAARSSEGAQAIWADAIRSRMEHDPAYVFASEEYGLGFAAALGARFVPVDPRREIFPISAGMIREHPFRHWSFIPDVVRPYFAKKVVVLDARGTLIPELAGRYETIHATDYPAYARSLALAAPGIAAAADLAAAQAASEAALMLQANRVLFTPTDPLFTLVQAGLPADDRREAIARLGNGHPNLAPDLIVAAQPVPRAYREAIAEIGWRLEERQGVDAARDAIVAYLDEILTDQ